MDFKVKLFQPILFQFSSLWLSKVVYENLYVKRKFAPRSASKVEWKHSIT